MRHLGLRERLLVFYALMALLPVMLSGGVLFLYLNSQVDNSAQQFQVGTLQEMRRYQIAVEQSVENVLTDSRKQMRQRTTQQLMRQRGHIQAEQATLLRETVADLQNTTREALRETEQATLQNLDATIQQLEARQTEANTQALAKLQHTTAIATRNALQEIVTQHMTHLSLQVSRQVESLLRNYAAQLTLIAQQPAIQGGDTQQSRWILQALQDREPAYLQISLLDSSGKPHLEIDDSLDDHEQIYAEQRALWERIQDSQETVWGEARLYRVEGRLRPLIPMMTPIRQMGAQFKGVVFALISPDELNVLARTLRVGERGFTLLAQKDGLILAHTDAMRVGQIDERLQQLLREVRQPRSMLSEYNTDEWLIAVAPIPRLNAALIVAQPAQEAFQLVAALQQSLEQSFAVQQEQTNLALAQANQVAQQQFRQQALRQKARMRERIQQAERRSLERSVESLNTLTKAQQNAIARTIDESFAQTQMELGHGLTTRLAEASRRAQTQLGEVAAEMRSRINTQIRDSFMLALLCVSAFLIVGALFLHRTLVRPLRILVKATHEIAAGNLNRRVELPERGCPDLDDLADSFNHMVDAVQKAEAQLIQSSKLASLGTLASGVAHELNQPLAIIRAIAQQNLETLDPTLTPQLISQLREDLQIIHRQTVRMSQIIQHLRAFSRKPREEFEPVSLNEVGMNALILLREQLRQRGIELIEEYEPTLPSVLGEANSLEQIVINLLTNARDALEGREDGQITLQTRLHDDGRHIYAELCVRDNGPGVPPDIRQQIFDPFFTTKDPNKGTGLGLAISLEIAQKHSGALLLGDSECGAEFILRIPIAQSQKQAA